jgi:GcrA cell cycle regulator
MNRGPRLPGTHTTSFWTPAVDAQLRKLWVAGVPSTAIAERLGCSKNSVIGRVHRLELKPRSSPIKGGPKVAAETRARNKAAKAKLVDALAETLRTQRASKPPAPAPRRVAPKFPFTPSPRAIGTPALGTPLPPPHVCQWPTGPRRSFLFCGEPAMPDRPYCLAHCEVAYVGFGRARADETARIWQRGKGW